jgi:hypothetical protein
MRCRTAILFGAMVLATVPASAQDYKPLEVSIGGGVTFPNSELRDHLGDGYNVIFGVTVNHSSVIGIEGLYSFNGLGEKRISIPVSPTPGAPAIPTDFFGNMNMQYGTVNLVVRKPEGAVRPYLVAGVGVYYRPIQVTTPGVGFVPGYCDPWWYVCYPGGFVPVENVVGERSSTDFGVDVGGGLIFGSRFFVEARYHYIWGPTIDTSAVGGSEARKANGQFMPITFGVRF